MGDDDDDDDDSFRELSCLVSCRNMSLLVTVSLSQQQVKCLDSCDMKMKFL